MKHVKEINFTFENYDRISFNNNSFGMIKIFDIETTITRIDVESISKFETANEMYFEIFTNANIDYKPFSELPSIENKTNEKYCKKFTRLLECADIVMVSVKYTDGSIDNFLVPHVGDKINLNEDVKLSQFGHLYLVISKSKKKVFDIFPENEFFSKSSEYLVNIRQNEISKHS